MGGALRAGGSESGKGTRHPVDGCSSPLLRALGDTVGHPSKPSPRPQVLEVFLHQLHQALVNVCVLDHLLL